MYFPPSAPFHVPSSPQPNFLSRNSVHVCMQQVPRMHENYPQLRNDVSAQPQPLPLLYRRQKITNAPFSRFFRPLQPEIDLQPDRPGSPPLSSRFG